MFHWSHVFFKNLTKINFFYPPRPPNFIITSALLSQGGGQFFLSKTIQKMRNTFLSHQNTELYYPRSLLSPWKVPHGKFRIEIATVVRWANFSLNKHRFLIDSVTNLENCRTASQFSYWKTIGFDGQCYKSLELSESESVFLWKNHWFLIVSVANPLNCRTASQLLIEKP